MRERKYRYSEIFGDTIQGEGFYTGYPTVWVRFWGCNFNCHGFGQKNLDDPSTWELPYQEIDETKYNRMEDLPVFHTGCDSSYSWAKKFSHLAHQSTAKEICDKLEECLANEHNPSGNFVHPKSHQDTHLAFTGGEPMMNQSGIVDIMDEFRYRCNPPGHVTIESNGTQQMRPNFIDFFSNRGKWHGELFWSVSPKLRASGEAWEKAIKPDNIKEYALISNKGQLKYVVDGSQETWDEVERATDLYRKSAVNWPVWIMPVGADMEMQEEHQAAITEEAVKRGYNVAARVHTWIFGNVIGK